MMRVMAMFMVIMTSVLDDDDGRDDYDCDDDPDDIFDEDEDDMDEEHDDPQLGAEIPICVSNCEGLRS